MRDGIATKQIDDDFNQWRADYCDRLLYDEDKPTPNGSIHRVMSWVLGNKEFHTTYTEFRPNQASFKLMSRVATADKQNLNDWEEIPTYDGFKHLIHETRKDKKLTSSDRKAQKNTDIHKSTEIPGNIIMKSLSGSHLYGLNHNGKGNAKPSDIDIRGVFILPTSEVVLHDVKSYKDFVEMPEGDEKYEEIGKFIGLCFGCNPERLELLNSTKTTEDSDVWKELVALRRSFYSKRSMYKALAGYAMGQYYSWRKSEGDLWKPGMHLIRLMLQGIKLFETGELVPDMTEHRDMLLSIRFGEVDREVVDTMFSELKTKFSALYDSSDKLEENPDRTPVYNFLREVRRTNW